MWHEILGNNIFVKNLYIEVPQLINVRIAKIEISDEGERISLLFDMPYYADNPPVKWKNQGYNAIVVQIDFFCINEIDLKSTHNTYRGNIEILKDESDLLIVKIDGTVKTRIIAEYGLIQSIDGYCIED